MHPLNMPVQIASSEILLTKVTFFFLVFMYLKDVSFQIGFSGRTVWTLWTFLQVCNDAFFMYYFDMSSEMSFTRKCIIAHVAIKPNPFVGRLGKAVRIAFEENSFPQSSHGKFLAFIWTVSMCLLKLSFFLNVILQIVHLESLSNLIVACFIFSIVCRF